MTPSQILSSLEAQGYHCRVSAGSLRVCGPKPMPVDIQRAIRDNKQALIAVLANLCPSCNQPLRTIENERYRYSECLLDPTHYFEAVNKRPGRMMGLWTDFAIAECAACGAQGETFNQLCEACCERQVEAERA